MKGDFDGQLVEIEGKLVDRLQQPAEQVLVVESGETIFNAQSSRRRVRLPWSRGRAFA